MCPWIACAHSQKWTRCLHTVQPQCKLYRTTWLVLCVAWHRMCPQLNKQTNAVFSTAYLSIRVMCHTPSINQRLTAQCARMNRWGGESSSGSSAACYLTASSRAHCSAGHLLSCTVHGGRRTSSKGRPHVCTFWHSLFYSLAEVPAGSPHTMYILFNHHIAESMQTVRDFVSDKSQSEIQLIY